MLIVYFALWMRNKLLTDYAVVTMTNSPIVNITIVNGLFIKNGINIIIITLIGRMGFRFLSNYLRS